MNARRLLLDQMIDVEVAEDLRRHGYDVVRIDVTLRPASLRPAQPQVL